jgi:hypothetical protein
MLSGVAARKQAAPRPIGRLCSNVRNGIVREKAGPPMTWAPPLLPVCVDPLLRALGSGDRERGAAAYEADALLQVRTRLRAESLWVGSRRDAETQFQRANCGSHLTHRWREPDSNPRSLSRRETQVRFAADSLVGWWRSARTVRRRLLW